MNKAIVQEYTAGACSIRPADRIGRIDEYYFSKKLKEVADLNAQGRRVINLGIGSPDLPPSDEAVDMFCQEIRHRDAHGYQPYSGIKAMRDAFAQWYAEWFGVMLDADTEILPLIGSKEGVLHVSMTFVNEGDGVLIPNPGYPTYVSVARLVGADVVSYRLHERYGWYPDFDELERAVAERAASGRQPIRLMWTNYPNMPTGANASRELYAHLVDFGRRHSILICNDNPYSFVLNDSPLSILSVEGAKETCVELNSLSKSHNMPGWRMGMCASHPQFIHWLLKMKSNVDSGQFRPMQMAVVKALQAGRSWYDNNNKIYRRRRVLAGRLMTALGCRFDENQTGMFLWGRISDSEENGAALTERLLYDKNIFITPGFIFGSAGERHIRISLCCNETLLEEAIRRIAG